MVKIEIIKIKLDSVSAPMQLLNRKLSMQWFLQMDKVAKFALDNVLNGENQTDPG